MFMKLCAISDMHGQYERITIPEDVDILICAGDATMDHDYQDAERFIRWFSTRKARYHVYTPGNHDFCFRDMPELKDTCRGAGIFYLEHNYTEIMGLKIFGSPHTPKFGDYAWMYRPDESDRIWSQVPDCDILITHGPPYGILDRNQNNEHCGSKRLLARVEQIRPKLHIFGHIHECGGQRQTMIWSKYFDTETIFWNAGIYHGTAGVAHVTLD
jgi:Icc-related predicted phosphoesterase